MTRFLPLAPALLLFAGSAHAQMMGSMTGTCSGTLPGGGAISGTVYLNVNGTRVVTTGGTAGGVFGLSECQCSTTEIALEIVMQTAAPLGADQGAQMWLGVGSDCTDVTGRTNACQQITRDLYRDPNTFNLKFSDFQVANRSFTIPLPAAVISSPRTGNRPGTFSCENITGESRSLTIILGDVATAPATCKISLPVRTALPKAPSGLSTRGGNGAVSVSWSAAQLTEGVDSYQVLCRKAGVDQPLPGKDFLARNQLYYSVCVDGIHYRRVNLPGTGPTQPTPDMAAPRASALGLPPRPGRTPQDEDMASSAADLAAPAPDMAPNSSFAKLDPRFLCSSQIRGAGETVEFRVDGLDNGSIYEFLVVAIDNYGNPSPSAIVTGSPQATENLLEALHRRGNYAGGFACAAGGPGAAPRFGLLGVLAAVPLALLGRRRRRARG